MATLKIIIKGEYFDQIKAGTKPIEFREVTPFWTSRLYTKEGKKREYEKIEFINGYNKEARRMITEYGGVLKKGGLYNIQIGRILTKKPAQKKETGKPNVSTKSKKVAVVQDGDYYIQYHNADALGRFPFTENSDLAVVQPDRSYRRKFAIYTSKGSVLRAKGSTCFLIVGIGGKEKKYYLWTCFRIDAVKSPDDLYIASGNGFNLSEAILLNYESGFDEFKKFCGNFGIGFQRINNHPFHKQLINLAAANR